MVLVWKLVSFCVTRGLALRRSEKVGELTGQVLWRLLQLVLNGQDGASMT